MSMPKMKIRNNCRLRNWKNLKLLHIIVNKRRIIK